MQETFLRGFPGLVQVSWLLVTRAKTYGRSWSMRPHGPRVGSLWGKESVTTFDARSQLCTGTILRNATKWKRPSNLAPMKCQKGRQGGRYLGYECHLGKRSLKTKELITWSVHPPNCVSESTSCIYFLRINFPRVFEPLLDGKKAYHSLSCQFQLSRVDKVTVVKFVFRFCCCW